MYKLNCLHRLYCIPFWCTSGESCKFPICFHQKLIYRILKTFPNATHSTFLMQCPTSGFLPPLLSFFPLSLSLSLSLFLPSLPLSLVPLLYPSDLSLSLSPSPYGTSSVCLHSSSFFVLNFFFFPPLLPSLSLSNYYIYFSCSFLIISFLILFIYQLFFSSL